MEIVVKKDQDNSEIIDVAHQIKIITKSQYDSSKHEGKLNKVRSIDYEQINIRGYQDDFDKGFDRIFVTDKRK